MSKKFLFLFIVLLLLNFVPAITAKKAVKEPPGKYLRPFSFNFGFNLSSNIYIYTPASNYFIDISGSTGISFSAEYMFYSFFGLESGFSLYADGQYKRTEYIYEKKDKYHKLDMITANGYCQHFISMKFYPYNPRFGEKNKLMIRLGFSYEAWILSYYWIYNNQTYQNSDFIFTSSKAGPNVYSKYMKYRDSYTPVNVGVHFGIGTELFVRKDVAFIPELKYTFFMLPVRNGSEAYPQITGDNELMVRNDYKSANNRSIFDFKMNVELSFTFKYYNGLKTDNLDNLLKKRKTKTTVNNKPAVKNNKNTVNTKKK